MYGAGVILWALQILERSRKHRCRSLPSGRDNVKTRVCRPKLPTHGAHNSLTRLSHKDDKHLGFVSLEAPDESDFERTA